MGVDGQLATLDTTGDNGTTAGDGEDVLDRHQERLVQVVNRGRDVVVDGVHEVLDGLDPLLVVRSVVVQSAVSGGVDDRAVAVEAVLVEEVADLFFDELDELFVVDHVALVQGDEDLRDANLTGEQHVLAGLGHRAVGGGHNEDGAIHLGSTGDHVLHEVGVARAVDVSVVTLLGLVLDVGDVDGDTAGGLFRSGIDLVEVVLRLTSGYSSCSTLEMAAVRVVLPWSTWPMVPMLTCGLVRSYFSFAITFVLLDVSCSLLTSQGTRYILLGFGFVPLWSQNPVSGI